MNEDLSAKAEELGGGEKLTYLGVLAALHALRGEPVQFVLLTPHSEIVTGARGVLGGGIETPELDALYKQQPGEQPGRQIFMVGSSHFVLSERGFLHGRREDDGYVLIYDHALISLRAGEDVSADEEDFVTKLARALARRQQEPDSDAG